MATLVGLLIALAGPALLASPLAARLGDPNTLRMQIIYQLILWGLFAALLAVILLWERKPLSSIGLRRFSWRSIAWGVIIAAVYIFVISPIVALLNPWEEGLRKIVVFPVWFRVFAAINAGIIEETFYRGYAIERLAAITRSTWLASAISILIFGVSHAPGWGLRGALAATIGGVVATLVYLWKRDLLVNIVPHSITDVVGLAVTA